MAQINNTTSYPEATAPLSSDSILIGSLASGVTNNFQLSDIATFVMGANTLTLQDVCDNGTATTTGITVAGTTTLNGTVDINNTADIADTLTLSKAINTGLYVEANAIVNGRLNVSGNTSLTNLEVTGATFRLAGSVPSSSTDTGSAGQIAVDATHIYVCVGTDSWGRVAIDTTPF